MDAFEVHVSTIRVAGRRAAEDASGRVFLITAQVCRQHMLQSKTAPAVATLGTRGCQG
jgi:hypothetical protein